MYPHCTLYSFLYSFKWTPYCIRTLSEMCKRTRARAHLNLEPFFVKIGQIFAAQWVFKHSKEFRNQRHFPSMTAICRFSSILQRLIVTRKLDRLYVKGAKRSMKMWTINFYQSFSINILLYMNGRLSKIRSVHKYIMHRMFYFEWYCTLILIVINSIWSS